MKRKNSILTILLLAIILLSITSILQTKQINSLQNRISIAESRLDILQLELEQLENQPATVPETYEIAQCSVPQIPEEKTYSEEVQLIALVTMAEAEGESEEGRRLVIDTILNRKDSERFPDTISGVIYQKNQFSSMWNGRVDRCEVREDICELVVQELACRTNRDVIFFNAKHYSSYGVPLFQVGNHYFSKYI